MKLDKKALLKDALDEKKLKKIVMSYFVKKKLPVMPVQIQDNLSIKYFYRSDVLKKNLVYYAEFYLYSIFYRKSEKEQFTIFCKRLNSYLRSNFTDSYLGQYYLKLSRYSQKVTQRQKKMGEIKKSKHFNIFEDDHFSNYTLELISWELFTVLNDYVIDYMRADLDERQVSHFVINKHLHIPSILLKTLFSENKIKKKFVCETFIDIYIMKDFLFLNTVKVVKKRYSPNHYDTSWCFIQLLFPGIKVKPDSLKQKVKKLVKSDS